MDLLIVGTGALATLFAARLSESGCRVSMLGTWPAGLEALRTHGARLVHADGREHGFRVHATSETRECRGARYALVLVKAWQTGRVARQLADCLAGDGLAVTLQNGLGNYETLAQGMGTARVALGSTTTGATLLGPGLVRAGGEGIISIQRHPVLGPLEQALRGGRFELQVIENAQSIVWGKLVVNAAINPLTALLRVPNGELLNRPAARELMGALAREAARVAGAVHVELPFTDPAAAAEEVASKTAANRSSMLQDVLRGAPTEIEAICGALTRLGQEHGLPTPANQICLQLIRALSEIHK